MALVQLDPLLTMLGFAISGDLGELTLYTKANGHLVWFFRTRPTRPATPPQCRARANMRFSGQNWRTMTSPHQGAWRRAVAQLSLCMTGYNAWTRYYIKMDQGFLYYLQGATGIWMESAWSDQFPEYPIPERLNPGRPHRYPEIPFNSFARHNPWCPANQALHLNVLFSNFDFAANTPLTGKWTLTGPGTLWEPQLNNRRWSTAIFYAPDAEAVTLVDLLATWPDGTKSRDYAVIKTWLP